RKAKRPVAIVGGAGWDGETGEEFARFAERIGLPVAGAFRRQDAILNSSPAWAGNLGYGPNPKLVQRIREADLLLVVGARLGEATTDGYALITPDHPGQTLVHVHPDPGELNRVYLADLPICARPFEFAATLAAEEEAELPRFDAEAAHADW
ncbi:thiamine pyrophosphate-binding protein, partial [Salmonella enterica subsp. enterica serovar Heidelberg]|nr:thiamine pyrophosphate-binding protein [Salmonella enterica subsp. enterica serovar Heidelberg]